MQAKSTVAELETPLMMYTVAQQSPTTYCLLITLDHREEMVNYGPGLGAAETVLA
jgi:hypothetical protein